MGCTVWKGPAAPRLHRSRPNVGLREGIARRTRSSGYVRRSSGGWTESSSRWAPTVDVPAGPGDTFAQRFETISPNGRMPPAASEREGDADVGTSSPLT
ncbi:MAG: hypothetical protein D6725_12375 [Planctomycetota bacterium]|nr:MAG: hypothetical protein D6725_12375 [Planctomycetota bacterium]